MKMYVIWPVKLKNELYQVNVILNNDLKRPRHPPPPLHDCVHHVKISVRVYSAIKRSILSHLLHYTNTKVSYVQRYTWHSSNIANDRALIYPEYTSTYSYHRMLMEKHFTEHNKCSHPRGKHISNLQG